MPKHHSSSEKNRKKSKKPCNCSKTIESPKYICSKCNAKIACEIPCKLDSKLDGKLACEISGKSVETKREPQNIFITFMN